MVAAVQAGAVRQRGRVWSRRITEEHRQVYSITNDALLVAACRYHF
ncbi:TPA: type II toxin-antitoxin system YoeB family toxin [Kluyvera intermedia]|nr:type II toxin-antitoxin system YoeB family toxin [Kluyvera intermedia]